MNLIGATAALTVIAAGGILGFTSINPDEIITNTQVVADAATCHTLTNAAATYYADNDAIAPDVNALVPYVSATPVVLAQYSMVEGIVQGPGCN